MGCTCSGGILQNQKIHFALLLSLGESLLTSSGKFRSVTSLLQKKKYVALYFARYQDDFCKIFTFELIKFYETLKAKDPHKLEIILIASDKSESDFNIHYFSSSQMPWLALPFNQQQRNDHLTMTYLVDKYPKLIIINPEDGAVITKEGKAKVSIDPDGLCFPWRDAPLREEIGNSFIDQAGETISYAQLSNKYLGLYFSSLGISPRKEQLPQLLSIYETRKKRGDFEVIFCSSDERKEDFDKYRSDMPWLSIPYGDHASRALKVRYDVKELPTLVIIDPKGNVVNKNAKARSKPAKDEQNSIVDDVSKSIVDTVRMSMSLLVGGNAAVPDVNADPVVDLSVSSESYGYHIFSKPSLIVFANMFGEETQAKIKAALWPLAEKMARDKLKQQGGPDMLFFLCTRVEYPTSLVSLFSWTPSVVDVIRSMAEMNNTPLNEPSVLILDKPENTYFRSNLTTAEDLNMSNMESFIDHFMDGSLEGKPIVGSSAPQSPTKPHFMLF